MATLREIAAKGAELNREIQALEALQQDRQNAQERAQALQDTIRAQRAVVDALAAELKAML